MLKINLESPVFLYNNFWPKSMVMFMVFVGLTAFFSLYFLKHYYPYFKEADDLFSIAGFMFIYVVITALIAVMVFTPYYLFIEWLLRLIGFSILKRWWSSVFSASLGWFYFLPVLGTSVCVYTSVLVRGGFLYKGFQNLLKLKGESLWL